MRPLELDFQNDEQLISEFIETKNNDLLGLLYSKYYQSVIHICLKYTRSRSDSEDLTQDIFIKAFDKIETLQNRVCFASWLFQISRNLCINKLKDKKNESFEDMEFFVKIATDIPEIDTKIEKEKLLMQALDSIEDLPATTREILVLKYLENYSLKQLEQKFMLGESAVKMRLLRAKKILRSQLEKI